MAFVYMSCSGFSATIPPVNHASLTTMFKSTSKSLITLIIAVLIIGSLGYGALWASLAIGVRALSTEWVEAQRKAGWAIFMQEPRLNGFPRWPEVIIENLSVTAPLKNGGWTWVASPLTVTPSALDLTRVQIKASGQHRLTSPVLPTAPWVLNTVNTEMVLDVDTAGRLQRGDILFQDAEFLDPKGLPIVGADRLALSLGLSEKNNADITMAFSGSGRDIRMAINAPPFARTIKAAQFEADLVGNIQPGRLQGAIEAWRTNGGALEVRRVFLDWPPLTIAGDGTLALDENLQPIAAFSTRITGFGETLTAMQQQGMLDRNQAASALMVLNLLSSNSSNSGRAEISLPLSVQDQRLSIGPFDMMTLPRLTWQ